MNYQIRTERAFRNVADNYVMSYKPNPAVFAYDDWRPNQARHELRELLERGRGSHVELIMKDISTVRYDPKRLWEWSDIAMETARQFAV